MTWRRILPWVVGCGLGLAFAAGFAWSRLGHRPQLPADARYANLPAGFARALESVRARVVSTDRDPAEIRRLARLYQANRLYAEARACYRVIAAAAGGLTARDHYYLADIAGNENDLPGAQAEFRAVLQAEPAYVPARLALAEALFKTGREEEAAREYAAVRAIEPDQPQASLGLARLALQRGDEAAALKILEDLMASHPESASGAALLAQILDRRGETERAAAMTLWSRQKHEPAPSDPWLEAMRVDCFDLQRLALTFEQYLMAGQMAEALPFLERIAELDPGNWTPQLLRGWSQERAGRHREAVVEYRAALQKGGDPEKICPLLVTSLLALGDLAEAATLLAEYHAKLPESVPILLSYADVAVRRGDEKLARELLGRVLQAEPYLYTPNMNLARILWAAGEREEAVKCLLRVIRVFPVDVASRGLVAQYYLEKHDPAAAIGPLEQALPHAGNRTPAQEKLTAMLAAAYVQAGTTEAEKGRFAAAVDLAEKAGRIAPDGLPAYALKANASLQLKQFQSAAEALEKMAALEPANPTIQLSLGDVLYQKGQADEARRHWEKARLLVAAGDDELRAALDLRLSGRITDETFK